MNITQIIPIHPEVAELLTEQQQRIERQAVQIHRQRDELLISAACGTQRWKELQDSRDQVERLQQQVLELGRQNIALAAEAERTELAEKQLAAADQRIAELEVALRLAKLPEESRSAVWREAA